MVPQPQQEKDKGREGKGREGKRKKTNPRVVETEDISISVLERGDETREVVAVVPELVEDGLHLGVREWAHLFFSSSLSSSQTGPDNQFDMR